MKKWVNQKFKAGCLAKGGVTCLTLNEFAILMRHEKK